MVLQSTTTARAFSDVRAPGLVTYSIRTESGPQGAILVLTGDADLSAAEELQQKLSAAAAEGDTVVTVDLTGTALLDSRSIAVLVEWTETLSEAGGRLPVICDNPNILRLLQRIGLDRTLTTFPSREQALSSAE